MGLKRLKISMDAIIGIVFGNAMLDISSMPRDTQFAGKVEYYEEDVDIETKIEGFYFLLSSESWLEVPEPPIFEVNMQAQIPKNIELMQFLLFAYPNVFNKVHSNPNYERLIKGGQNDIEMAQGIMKTAIQTTVKEYFQELKKNAK